MFWLRFIAVVCSSFVFLACQASRPRPAQPSEAAFRAATAPGPRGPMTEEEAWYHDNYGHLPAIEVRFGKATYYGEALAGNKTASGEIFDPWRFTAAHRRLPFGTVVRVVRLSDGAHTYVKINDRGPFGDDRRVIDLAKIAATRIHMIDDGVVDVRLEILLWGDGQHVRMAGR